MAFSLADKIMLVSLLAVSLLFAIYQIFCSFIPLEILTMFALLLSPPPTFFMWNIHGELRWPIFKYSFFSALFLFVVGSFSLQLVIDNGLVEQDWAFLWMEVVRAASILYSFPLYFGVIRWRMEEDDYESELKIALPGGFEIRAIEGSLASLILESAGEIWRSFVCTFLYFGLVCSKVVLVAAVYHCLGLDAAETAVALLSLASTVSYLHAAYRYSYEPDNLPRSTVIRGSLRLFLVLIPAVLGGCAWLCRDDLSLFNHIARGTNQFRQPASMIFQMQLLQTERRRRMGLRAD